MHCHRLEARLTNSSLAAQECYEEDLALNKLTTIYFSLPWRVNVHVVFYLCQKQITDVRLHFLSLSLVRSLVAFSSRSLSLSVQRKDRTGEFFVH